MRFPLLALCISTTAAAQEVARPRVPGAPPPVGASADTSPFRVQRASDASDTVITLPTRGANADGFTMTRLRVPPRVNVDRFSEVRRRPFGKLPDGTPVEAYAFGNSLVSMEVITYGAIIISLATQDRAGRYDDIVLGYDSLEGYLKSSPYFGAIVGRYANRIAKGRFTIDGKPYQLPINNGPNSLHGGTRGLDKVVWQAEPFDDARGQGVIMRHSSPDGDMGYPGTLDVKVTYTLTDSLLTVDYEATTDKATPVNLSQHSYFNLSGGSRDILGHQLQLNASRYTPVDSTLIPTGELASVAGTPFDFRTPTAIGARINEAHDQVKKGGGYDHNFVLDGTGMRVAARVTEPVTGRTMEIRTDQPGIQFYSGNFLDGSITGKGGIVYRHRWGFCLETQHFPDSPNHAAFPSTVLRAGEVYRTRTVFSFGVVK